MNESQLAQEPSKENTGIPSIGVRAIIVAFGLLLFITARVSMHSNDFYNPDIAGITYNADLILNGGLPYVDSHEFKAPGTFFLFALFFSLIGRSLDSLQALYGIWILIGAFGVWIAARSLYGSKGENIAPEIVLAVYLASAGQFDYNYSAWMVPAYVWAFTSLILAFETGKYRWHLFAGFCAMAAFMLKRQAVVLMFVFPLIYLWGWWEGQPGAKKKSFGLWICGALLCVFPLLLLYWLNGQLRELVSGVLPFARVGKYRDMQQDINGFLVLWLIAKQLVQVFPFGAAATVSCLLASMYTVFWRTGSTNESVEAGERLTVKNGSILPPLILLVFSIYAGKLGGTRYYLHYLIQYLPGLSLLAGHPLLWNLLKSKSTLKSRFPVRFICMTLCLTGMVWQGGELLIGKGQRCEIIQRRLTSGLTAPQSVGKFIRDRTTAEERVMVWGWSAWSVYFWSERMAPTSVYKAMGTVTNFNTNGSFFPSTPIHFKPGPEADALVHAFQISPPAFFVMSPSYRTVFKSPVDPLEEWDELADILVRDYKRVARIGAIRVLEHRSRIK